MQDSDVTQFDRAFSRLCAAYNTPPTKERREAYWRSFRKLQTLEFIGLVDAATVDSRIASMPTVGVLWELHERLQPKVSNPGGSRGPTIQEELCEYVARKLTPILIPPGATREMRWAFSRPWTYLYREWSENGKRCAECTGVLVEMPDGSHLRFNVADMRAAKELAFA